MKLKLVLQGDVGDAVVTEGDVGFIGKSKNITGNKNGKDYSFYSQFVTIDDAGDTIGANIAFDTEAECIQNKGEHIKIKGTLESYEKNGETRMSVGRAKLVSRSGGASPQQATQHQAGNKDRLIVAQVVYKVLGQVSSQFPRVDETALREDVDMIMRVGSGEVAPPAPKPEPAVEEEDGDSIPF